MSWKPFRRILSICLLCLFFSASLLALSNPADAKQDGILVAFADVASGANCVGGVYSQNCQTTTDRQYTVQIGGQQLVLVHQLSKAEMRSQIGVGIWKLPSSNHSVFFNQPLGTHFQSWNDKEGLYAEIAGKKSLFVIRSASTLQPK